MENEQEFDFERFKQEAIKGMYAGKPLNGTQGIFAPLLKHFLESALAGELEAHLQEEKAAGLANRSNGRTSKKVKSLSGEFELETSRDRSGLKGFPEAIAAVFPQTEIQTCVVHQIRSSLRYIAEKDKKAIMADFKFTKL